MIDVDFKYNNLREYVSETSRASAQYTQYPPIAPATLESEITNRNDETMNSDLRENSSARPRELSREHVPSLQSERVPPSILAAETINLPR